MLDNDPDTKWLDFRRGDLEFAFESPVAVASYTWATANDCPERDPTSWRLDAKREGEDEWIAVDSHDGRDVEVPHERLVQVGPFDVALA